MLMDSKGTPLTEWITLPELASSGEEPENIENSKSRRNSQNIENSQNTENREGEYAEYTFTRELHGITQGKHIK